MDLTHLFDLYGTDKNLNGYSPVYHILFDDRRREPLNVLEIGIGTMVPGVHSSMVGYALDGYRPGGSLRAWRDYFVNSRICGVDVQPDTQFAEERISTFLCDSTDARAVDALFERLGEPRFDIVIDDGSHVDSNQEATLRNFYPRVKRGGYYIIEDVHPESTILNDPMVLRSVCGDAFFFAGIKALLCVIRKDHDASETAHGAPEPRRPGRSRGDTAVVVPCFNLGRFIGEALESVWGQSRAPSEVVVVDDGSTDPSTREVLAAIERPGTRLVRTANRGPSAARNRGIGMTSADYVIALDADDRLDPEYVARTAARLDAAPDVDFVTTAMRSFGEASYEWTPPECTVANALVRGGPHPATIFRRRMWEAVGGFDESPPLKGCEDVDFWLSAMELGCRGDVLEEPLFEYRIRGDSLHHGLVSNGAQAGVMAAVLRKHGAEIARIGPELLLAKERFLLEMRAHEAHMRRRSAELRDELRQLEAAVARTGAEIVRSGWGPPRWGELGRGEPFGPPGGPRRGASPEAVYVESFVARHTDDRRGGALEVRDLGGADLTGQPDASADCIVATDAMRGAYDVPAALREIHRVLRPGGVLLCAFPATRPMTGASADDRDFWRFTETSVRRLVEDVFPRAGVEVETSGNLLVCAASLVGLADDELEPGELEPVDPRFPVTYCVRAVKS